MAHPGKLKPQPGAIYGGRSFIPRLEKTGKEGYWKNAVQ
jgi:hypothetical protein